MNSSANAASVPVLPAAAPKQPSAPMTLASDSNVTTGNPTVQECPLANNFRCDGFDLVLLERIGDATLWEKTHADIPGRRWFEVMLVRHHPSSNWLGRKWPAKELPPPTATWGTHGWTYPDIGSARQRLTACVALKSGESILVS